MNIIEAQKALYKQVFDDSDIFVDAFFAQMVTEESSFYIPYNNEVIASLQLFEYEADIKGKRYKCGYIYAVMTHPRYRHLGLMTRLMNRAIEEARRREYHFVFLIADSIKLCLMYENFGFRSEYLSPDGGTIFLPPRYDNSVVKGDIDACYDIYQRYAHDSIILSYKQFRFVCETTIAEGGRLLFYCEDKDEPTFGLYRFNGKTCCSLASFGYYGNELDRHAATSYWMETHSIDEVKRERITLDYPFKGYMVLLLDNNLSFSEVATLQHKLLMEN
ncbi:MAG: GNAT family N-acetyltransferase [Bacteroidales bacterium]|nr:GNAT family N-acetyltransferase [Bacteroidales bacterium]